MIKWLKKWWNEQPMENPPSLGIKEPTSAPSFAKPLPEKFDDASCLVKGLVQTIRSGEWKQEAVNDMTSSFSDIVIRATSEFGELHVMDRCRDWNFPDYDQRTVVFKPAYRVNEYEVTTFRKTDNAVLIEALFQEFVVPTPAYQRTLIQRKKKQDLLDRIKALGCPTK